MFRKGYLIHVNFVDRGLNLVAIPIRFSPLNLHIRGSKGTYTPNKVLLKEKKAKEVSLIPIIKRTLLKIR